MTPELLVVEEAGPVDRLLCQALSDLGESAHNLLHPLIDYDAKHNGDLVRTLRMYLSMGCNATRTAEVLFLHRSGLLYRLRRIEELLGVRLDRYPDRVALELAVMAGSQPAQRAL